MAGLLDEPELTSSADLCLPDGRLNRAAIGWSRGPLLMCNLPASLPRKKRWNYWCVTGSDLLFSATIVDLDIAQMAFAYYYDRMTGAFAEKTVVAASGTSLMPETPRGDVVLDHPQMRVALLDDGGGTRLAVDAADFRGSPLSADIRIERPGGHETLNVVIPWSDDQFQFTSKQNTLPATGSVSIGDRAYRFAAPSFACLDYGRGVWPEETQWNWGAASGVQGSRAIGLNLGGRWTDGTGMTENAICVDGRLTKISEDLTFEYDRADVMKRWHIRSTASDRIDLTFTPQYERVSNGGNEAYFSEVHQVFGNYDGRITTSDGLPIELNALFGWIEDHTARW